MGKVINFTDINENKLNYISSLSSGATNNEKRRQMKLILLKAIDGELTQRQKYCVTEYFFAGKRQYEIANSLGVNKSTVSRHIEQAQKKLKTIAKYYA